MDYRSMNATQYNSKQLLYAKLKYLEEAKA